MLKVAVFGVMAAILAVWLKGIKTEYSVWITVIASTFLGIFAAVKLEIIVGELVFLQSFMSSYSSYFKLLIKIIGITYLAEFSSDMCKDAGAGALASQVELFGKLSILALCMPIMTSLLETIEYFLGG